VWRQTRLWCTSGMLLLAACAGESTRPATVPQVALVDIPIDTALVAIGDSVGLVAVAKDSADNIITSCLVKWRSRDTTVAAVSGNGLVVGVTRGTTRVTATCEGKSDSVTIAVRLRFASLSAGLDHTCGVLTSGDAYCWGYNGTGQLGMGSRDTMFALTPVRVVGGVKYSALGSTALSTCGLSMSGSVWCWGTTPTLIPGGLTFVALTVSDTSCALTVSGLAYCWGATPILVDSGLTFGSLAAGGSHVCAIAVGGAAYCWGSNSYGELGDGSTTASAAPVPVAGGLRFEYLTAYSKYTCGIVVGGSAYCWGSNRWGKLGNGSTTDSPSPVAVAGSLRFTSLSAGQNHVCGVTLPGDAYCWGLNDWGQFGNGTTAASPTPVPAGTGQRFTRLSAGGAHVCGLGTDGVAYCWGLGASGQVGGGILNNRNLGPVRVVGQ